MYNRLVKNKRLILSLPLLLAASLFIPSHVAPSAHAAGFTGTGLVCITASTTATNCDNNAPTIGPLTVGTTFTVGVFINNSQPMGGWDIYVRSDPAFLHPVSAALGTLIASPTLTSICVNGSAQTGSCTVGAANGPGVVEVTSVESSGSNECGNIAPCSGMGFTITYQVVGATPSTTLSYPTSAGCSFSSVSSPPNTCVLIADNLGTTLPENIQGATVTLTLPSAIVCVTFPATDTKCHVGPPNVPVTPGTPYTVGVFVQNSAPMAGFDIYIGVDTNYLSPTSASLGTLIANPASPDICVNGSAQNGTCTANTANGPGVVEVSTFESSGTNECTAAPCSGLAFTVTYLVKGVTPTTSIDYPTAPGCFVSSASSPPNTCVLVANATGTTLPENIQPATAIHPAFVNPTIPPILCPSPTPVGRAITCTVTVTDNNATGAIAPINPKDRSFVTWTTDGPGVFQPTNRCTIQPNGPTQPNKSSCSVTYLPNDVGPGIHNIGVIYGGDTVHSGSTAATPSGTVPAFQLVVTKDSPVVSASITVDNTGQPIPTGGILLGTAIHDTVIMTKGAPPTGVTGSVTYRLYSNGGCAGTGTAISTATVLSGTADNVAVSASVTPSPAGSYSINAIYSGDGDNFAVTTTCQSFTVSDYSLTASSTSLTIQSGGSKFDVVNLTSLGAFTGGATLTSSALPSGVTVQFVPNPVTITTAGGFATSTMAVFISPTVVAGTVFSYSVSVRGTSVHTISISVTVIAGPTLVNPKIQFKHHLSLSHSSNTQSWTATVSNPLSGSIKALIRIVGHSTTNPSRTFDVTCGVTCVNTATGGVNATPGLTPVTVAAGAVAAPFSFSQSISGSFANQKVTWTATLYFVSTGTVYGPANSTSGSFTVVP